MVIVEKKCIYKTIGQLIILCYLNQIHNTRNTRYVTEFQLVFSDINVSHFFNNH